MGMGLGGGHDDGLGNVAAADERLAEPRRLGDRVGGGQALFGVAAQVGLLAAQDLGGRRLGPRGVSGVCKVLVHQRLRRRGTVLGIPHQTPGHKVAQGRRPLGRLQDGVHGMGRHLGKGEAELGGQAGALAPFAAADAGASLVVPVARAAHDLADPPHLVDLVSAGEEGLERGNLDGHGADGPDVDGGGILAGAQENLGGAVPARGHVGGVGQLGVRLAGEAKVGQLDGVGGRGRGRCNQGRVSSEGV
jgi:hypothetical protein